MNDTSTTENRFFSKKNRLIILLIGISCFVLFFDLGGRGFQNKDYLRFAESAREMMYTGDYIVPHYVGKVYLAKPPLFMWSIALLSKFNGSVTPFAARIPSAICALLSIITVFLFGNHLYKNPFAGFFAGLVLLSNYMFFFYARIVKTDMMLTTFILTALYSFYMAYTSEPHKRRTFFMLFYVSISFGILAKGPLAFILPLLIIFTYLFIKKDLSFFKNMQWLMGLCILLLMVGPWVILLSQKLGFNTIVKNVFSESVVRYGTAEYGHKQPFYFFFPELIKGFLPYSIFFPAIYFFLYSKKGEKQNVDRLWLSLWFTTIFIFMSFSRCKSGRYILPLYPAVALMFGGMWAEVPFAETKNVFWGKWVKYTTIAAFAIIIIASWGLLFYTRTHFTELFPISIGICIVFTAAIVCRSFFKNLRNYTFSYAIIFLFFVSIGLVYMKELTAYNYNHSLGLDLANFVSQYVKEDELYYYKVPDECLSPIDFYLNRIIPEVTEETQIASTFLSDKTIYCIVEKKAYNETLAAFQHILHTPVDEVRYKDIDLILLKNISNTYSTAW
ncbi:MAG: glycosyltransferase family 39 protein [Candidatus Kuenenia sp.]|nr:glycosyltransferase family 39 protein [Candidatus Kuenenia hertensis]